MPQARDSDDRAAARARHPDRPRQRRRRRAAGCRRVRRPGQRHARQHLARHVPLRVPTLRRLGLERVSRASPPTVATAARSAPSAAWRKRRRARIRSPGHWELMGLVLERPFPTFPHGFPPELMAAFERAHRPRVHSATTPPPARRSSTSSAPSTSRTGKPIVYTSADSVFQIAAHEDVVPVRGAVPLLRDRLRARGERPRHRAGDRAAVRRRARRVHADVEPARLRADAVRADAARSARGVPGTRSWRSARSRICSPGAG